MFLFFFKWSKTPEGNCVVIRNLLTSSGVYTNHNRFAPVDTHASMCACSPSWTPQSHVKWTLCASVSRSHDGRGTAVQITRLYTYQRTNGAGRTESSGHINARSDPLEVHREVHCNIGMITQSYLFWLQLKHPLQFGCYLSFPSASFLSPADTPLI